ncbi:MAG: TolC family protein [candidate division WOR-3 bacterium]
MFFAIIFLMQIDTISLQEAIDIALNRSPTYLESQATLAKTKIQFLRALSYLLPTNSTTGSWTESEYQKIQSTYYAGSINFTFPLFDLDVISAIFTAHGQKQGATIKYQQDVGNLVLNIKKAYYNIITANELVKAADKAMLRALENKKLAEIKYKLGSASRLELLQAEVFYFQTLQNNSRAKAFEAQAQQELKALLNIDRDIYPTDTFVTPDTFVLPDLDSLKKLLQTVNWNIRLAKQMYNLSRTNLWFAILAFLPKISLFYGYNTKVDSFSLDFDYLERNTTKNYGVNISFPIFEIKSLIFNYLEAKKDLQIKKFNLEKTTLESEKALLTSYYGFQEAIDKLRFSRKSLEVASEASAIAYEQYNLGVISFLDLLKTEEDYYNARVNYLQALNDYYLQQANFSYLLGMITLGAQ